MNEEEIIIVNTMMEKFSDEVNTVIKLLMDLQMKFLGTEGKPLSTYIMFYEIMRELGENGIVYLKDKNPEAIEFIMETQNVVRKVTSIQPGECPPKGL